MKTYKLERTLLYVFTFLVLTILMIKCDPAPAQSYEKDTILISYPWKTSGITMKEYNTRINSRMDSLFSNKDTVYVLLAYPANHYTSNSWPYYNPEPIQYQYCSKDTYVPAAILFSTFYFVNTMSVYKYDQRQRGLVALTGMITSTVTYFTIVYINKHKYRNRHG